MTLEALDALFVPFYADVDRWYDDGSDDDLLVPSQSRAQGILSALSADEWMKDEVDLVIDGRLYDFSRFLSWVRSGTTADRDAYDPFSMTLLAGSYYLSLLSAHGYRVRVANAVDRHALARLSRRYDPRFVLLSTSLLFDGAQRELIPMAVAQIRRLWPDAIIVLGGLLLVSYEKNLPPAAFHALLRRYGADVYVVSPRGEAPLLEVLERGSVRALVTGPGIPSTYVVSRGRVHPPAGVEPELSMDETGIRWSQLPQTDHLYHTVHVRTARSCAFRCAFCEYPVNQGPLTLVGVESVAKELGELRDLGRVRSLIFTDDTFNVPLRRFKAVLEVLCRYDFEWYSFFRPQYTDAETAKLMRRSGCRGVFAGLESVNDQVLKNMSKAARGEQYRRGIAYLKEQDINVHANFIVGFPGDTEESAREIVSFLDDMRIDFCTVCTWVYIPSTPIGARAAEFGIEGLGVDWKHQTMTSEQAQRLARRVVEEQKFSVHNAVRGEAWSEFLLYANRFTVDDVRLAIGTFNRFLGRDVSAEEVRSAPGFAALRAVLAARPVPAPAR